MTRVIAIGNQKGGVGKTSTALGLAAAAAADGQRVLLVDLDPQANATDVLMGAAAEDDRGPGAGSYGLLADPKRGGGAALADVIRPAGPDWTGVEVVPAVDALADVDVDTSPAQPLRLRRALEAASALLAERYDLVLLDCPPSLGRILIAALVAADDVLIVTEPGGHALRGVGRLEETMAEVREGFAQESPALLGVVVNRVKRATEHTYRAAELREAYGDLVLAGGIPERVAVADAASSGRPVHALSGEGALVVASVLNGTWAQVRARLDGGAPLDLRDTTTPTTSAAGQRPVASGATS